MEKSRAVTLSGSQVENTVMHTERSPQQSGGLVFRTVVAGEDGLFNCPRQTRADVSGTLPAAAGGVAVRFRTSDSTQDQLVATHSACEC